MIESRHPRRHFLKAATVATAAYLATGAGRSGAGRSGAGRSGAGRSGAASGAGRVRLGAPVFGEYDDPEQRARAHVQLGYGAAYCPKVPLDDKERIRDVERAFEKHDVVLAEVGVWCNLMDQDPSKRVTNLQRVTEGLALADEVGARCCVNIAGSFNPEVWYGPDPKNFSQDAFDLAVENARKIIDAVQPKRAKFAYEMMGWAYPSSPDEYLRMIRSVGREGFAVHLDPCNGINSPSRFYDNTAFLNECFDKLGPHIVSCHAKDLAWVVEMNVHFQEVVLGTGSLDYKTYLRRLAELPGEVPLLVEHMKGAEEYDRSREYVFEVGESIGIEF